LLFEISHFLFSVTVANGQDSDLIHISVNQLALEDQQGKGNEKQVIMMK